MDIQIETKRLKLKLLTEDDLNDLVQLNLDPEVRAFFPDGVQNAEQTKKKNAGVNRQLHQTPLTWIYNVRERIYHNLVNIIHA